MASSSANPQPPIRCPDISLVETIQVGWEIVSRWEMYNVDVNIIERLAWEKLTSRFNAKGLYH